MNFIQFSNAEMAIKLTVKVVTGCKKDFEALNLDCSLDEDLAKYVFLWNSNECKKTNQYMRKVV